MWNDGKGPNAITQRNRIAGFAAVVEEGRREHVVTNLLLYLNLSITSSTMKKMILTAAVIAAAAMTVSCNKDIDNTGLGVDVEVINYPLGGGTYDIHLTAETPWEASHFPKWVTVTPESGSGNATITIGVDAWDNEDNEAGCTAYLVITDRTDTAVVVIDQINDDNKERGPVESDHDFSRDEYIPNYLTVNNTEINLTSQDASTSFNIDADCSWWTECDAEWITVSPASGRGWKAVTVSAHDWTDPENESRTATPKVCYNTYIDKPGTSSITITVTQSAEN